ncbi:MAG: hypothetical protein H7A25_09510 [Leptospiraceae bacterium]|nr:hypothetical protein [Leptospiraceae bacterium]
MNERLFEPNQIRYAKEIIEPGIYRDGRWRYYDEPELVSHSLCGKNFLLRPGLTFTPYANPTACNAHCLFCSEELLRKDGEYLTAKRTIHDHDGYFKGLEKFFREIRGFPLGLSLSGLEATNDSNWFLRLMELLEENKDIFAEKVLYSNGSGLLRNPHFLDILIKLNFDRIELSRCSFDTEINQNIMRFNRTEPVYRQEGFLSLLDLLRDRIHTKLSCILNRKGVSSLKDIEDYITKARQGGIKEIVFRELSQLGDLYHINSFVQWIEDHRVSARKFMDDIYPEKNKIREGWEFIAATCGYYYYNEIYSFQNVQVIFETSSYVVHQEAQTKGVIHKLVFHSNGDLCGDWVPNSNKLGNYYG